MLTLHALQMYILSLLLITNIYHLLFIGQRLVRPVGTDNIHRYTTSECMVLSETDKMTVCNRSLTRYVTCHSKYVCTGQN